MPKDDLTYADNSPLKAEMKKPAIKYVKYHSYGLKKLKRNMICYLVLPTDTQHMTITPLLLLGVMEKPISLLLFIYQEFFFKMKSV